MFLFSGYLISYQIFKKTQRHNIIMENEILREIVYKLVNKIELDEKDKEIIEEIVKETRYD